MMKVQFSSRSVPWAKIGTVIEDDDVDIETAITLGGLDFEVELCHAAFSSNGDDWTPVDHRRATVRKDTQEFYSFVSTDYIPVQYRDAFEFIGLINPRVCAAGALSGGRQGFIVIQMPDSERIDPSPLGVSDPIDLYAVLRTSHDLSRSAEIAVLPLRERCMNQLPFRSLTRDAPQRWSIPHIGDPHKKLAEAHQSLSNFNRYVDVFNAQVQQLASVEITSTELRQIVTAVLPNRVKRDEQVNAIDEIFRTSNEVGKEFYRTGWGAVNAVSEYFEHQRPVGTRTAQSQFTSGLDGDTMKFVTRTAQLVMSHA